MKVAIIGSRSITIENIEDYLPSQTTEIVSGGAKGVDSCAKDYAVKHGIKLTEFIPEYDKYKRFAPLKRNLEIIYYSDLILAFWDGQSKGTKYTIDKCKQIGKEIKVYIV